MNGGTVVSAVDSSFALAVLLVTVNAFNAGESGSVLTPEEEPD